MPITSSAKKALRASRRKRVFNVRRQRAIERAEKNIRKLLLQKNFTEARAALSAAYKGLDKAVKTNFLKKNTAARRKSRLTKFLNKAMQAGK